MRVIISVLIVATLIIIMYMNQNPSKATSKIQVILSIEVNGDVINANLNFKNNSAESFTVDKRLYSGDYSTSVFNITSSDGIEIQPSGITQKISAPSSTDLDILQPGEERSSSFRIDEYYNWIQGLLPHSYTIRYHAYHFSKSQEEISEISELTSNPVIFSYSYEKPWAQ